MLGPKKLVVKLFMVLANHSGALLNKISALTWLQVHNIQNTWWYWQPHHSVLLSPPLQYTPEINGSYKRSQFEQAVSTFLFFKIVDQRWRKKHVQNTQMKNINKKKHEYQVIIHISINDYHLNVKVIS